MQKNHLPDAFASVRLSALLWVGVRLRVNLCPAAVCLLKLPCRFLMPCLEKFDDGADKGVASGFVCFPFFTTIRMHAL